MKNLSAFFLLMALLGLGVACSNESQFEEDREEMVEDMEEGVDELGDDIQEGTDEIVD
jgi:uncharacterized protein YgfB (UPF0149 family)